MPQRWRPVICLVLSLLAACGGGAPELATIEPIPGSRTREGGEIVPLDRTSKLTAEGNIAGEIRRLGDSTAARSRTIVPITVPQGRADTLLGTTWLGEGLDGAITFEFLPSGVLRYTTGDDSYSNGTWQQRGNAVSFEMNARFAEWSGRIEATRMAGSAHNSAGRSWSWQATRR